MGVKLTDSHLGAIEGEALRELGISSADEVDVNLISTAHRAGARSGSKGNGESEDVGELHYESD